VFSQVCTSTLAWGVNFPAHLVVVKGTEYYDGKAKRYVDFPVTDVLQVSVYVDIYIYIYMCVYIYIHIYECVCVCVYIYIGLRINQTP